MDKIYIRSTHFTYEELQSIKRNTVMVQWNFGGKFHSSSMTLEQFLHLKEQDIDKMIDDIARADGYVKAAQQMIKDAGPHLKGLINTIIKREIV